MKCENCGKNEVSFYYKETINGHTHERKLCRECAEREGLFRSEDLSPAAIFGEFRTMFEDFFGEREFAFAVPRARAFSAMPRRTRGEAMSEAEAAIPEDAGSELRRRREKEALRCQLDAAVAREDYEEAARLRDRLKGM